MCWAYPKQPADSAPTPSLEQKPCDFPTPIPPQSLQSCVMIGRCICSSFLKEFVSYYGPTLPDMPRPTPTVILLGGLWPRT